MSLNPATPFSAPLTAEASPERQAVARIAVFFENLKSADVNRMAEF